MEKFETTLRLGTRGSRLALAQSGQVAASLAMRWPGLQIETIIIKTTGDRITDQPLHDAGGKGLFVKELELALLADEVDFAVHSCKDMPVTMPVVDESNLVIAAMPSRGDPRDVLITKAGVTLDALPAGASVGTGSLRRRCQLLVLRPDLLIEPIRGNIDTRLRKLHADEFDALVLALAGVQRAGLFDAVCMIPIDVDQILPAPAQGALALQCRADDARTREWLNGVNDALTTECVSAERDMVRLLNGDCHSPIAVLVECVGNGTQRRIRSAVGRRGGELPVLRAEVTSDNLSDAVARVFVDLSRGGAMAALHGVPSP